MVDSTGATNAATVRRLLHDGDVIAWGQGCAEPRSLIRDLAADPLLPDVTCLVGFPGDSAARPPTLRYLSYCGTGANSELHRQGRLSVLPIPYSRMADQLDTGVLRADVVVLQVPPADPSGLHGIGVAAEYLVPALRTARAVVGLVNRNVPYACGPHRFRPEQFTVLLDYDEPLAELPSAPSTPTLEKVALHVAGLVEDRATVQVGMGRLPAAVLRALRDHRGLGVHSGLISDEIADLVDHGAVTNEHKPFDRGVTTVGLLSGTMRLFDFAHRNPAVELRSTQYTHAPEVLAALPRFTSVNSALEVDVTGQINTEVGAGRYLGAVGGAIDFVRGAHCSAGGVPITALEATAGARSRVVARLTGPTSVARADAGVVVTEYGTADLRSSSLEQRVERMIAIAAPHHRHELDQRADEILRAAHRPDPARAVSPLDRRVLARPERSKGSRP